MRAFISRAALAVLLVPYGVSAQSLTITEIQALGRLAPESPRVRAIRADAEVARAGVAAAGRWPNPRVTFTRESVAGITEALTTVGQVLPVTGRRRFDVDAAAALVDASVKRGDDQVRRLRADLRLAYTDLWSAQARERELARGRDRVQALGVVLERREAEGEAAGFDRIRAEREVLDLEADRALAAADRTRAQTTLTAFFADSTEAASVVAVEPEASRAPLPDVDALLARAQMVRGEFLAFADERRSAELASRAADRRRYPEPEVVAGTKSSTFAGGDLGSIIGVQATIALFDRSRPERALAEARIAQASTRAEAMRSTLRAQIAALRATVLERRDAADRYRAGLSRTAAEVERIAQVSYEAGERGILELLDAYRTSSSARVRQVALDAAVRQAEIELEFACGWEMP
jgi:cobalt-zinc-cadmium efflux system outer membrane protein